MPSESDAKLDAILALTQTVVNKVTDLESRLVIVESGATAREQLDNPEFNPFAHRTKAQEDEFAARQANDLTKLEAIYAKVRQAAENSGRAIPPAQLFTDDDAFRVAELMRKGELTIEDQLGSNVIVISSHAPDVADFSNPSTRS